MPTPKKVQKKSDTTKKKTSNKKVEKVLLVKKTKPRTAVVLKVATKPVVKKNPAAPLGAASNKAKEAFAKTTASAKKVIAPVLENVQALPHEALTRATSAIHKIKEYFKWGFAVVALFAVLSILAAYNSELFGSERSPDSGGSQASVITTGDQPITVVLTGNLLLARYVEQRMRALNDYTYPFHNVAEFTKSADITFGNLDTPLLPGQTVGEGSFIMRGDPSSVEGLVFAGFDVLNVANNQMMNYQETSIISTVDAIRDAELKWVGGGANQDAAHTPAVFEVKGKTFAFYAYTDPNIPPRRDDFAQENKPGLAKMEIEAVQNDVKNAKQYADVVIVSMHAGSDSAKEPTQFQKDFAHAAIDAGATVVVGHHPSVVQPIEQYGEGVIFYSLGNFVSDQFYSEDVRTGLAVKLSFHKDGRTVVDLYPVRLDSVQPKVITEQSEREAILKEMGVAPAAQ